MKASEGSVSGNNSVGGIAGTGSGYNYEVNNVNVSGNNFVGGIMRKKIYKL